MPLEIRSPWTWWLEEAEARGYDTDAIRAYLGEPEHSYIWDWDGNWTGPDVEPELIAFLTHKMDTDYPVAVIS